ncbi:MAG: FAD binding domain-containing protein [Mogibacterium sp.]|nr:FAD binding domain-containing protein [Mogibacterium sp.]
MATQLLMAKSPEEAIGAKNASAVFIAGGTEVNRLGSDAAAAADTLISLKRCAGLNLIEDDGDNIRLGAMCTFQQIVESEKTPSYLKEAARFMASRTKRNMATIGGNIAALRDDSYMLPVLFAVHAELEVLKASGTEKMSAYSYMEAAEAGGDMLITAVIVPKNMKVASKRYANTAQSHAVLTMSAAMTGEGISLYGAVKNVGLLYFCDLEKKFRENPDVSEDEIIEMVRVCTGLETADDMFGSDAYKRYLIGVTAFDLHSKLAGKEV